MERSTGEVNPTDPQEGKVPWWWLLASLILASALSPRSNEREIDTRRIGWWRGFPRWFWLVMLAAIALSGSFLWQQGLSPCPDWEAWNEIELPPSNGWLFVATIYVFAVTAGWLVQQIFQTAFDYLTTSELRSDDQDRARKRPNTFPAAFVGFVEAVLYPTTFLVGRAEFLAAWIALKAAGAWKTWEVGHEGRRIFNRFLWGNGISFGLGALTYVALRILAFCSTEFRFP